MGIANPQNTKRLGHFLTTDCKSVGTPNGRNDGGGLCLSPAKRPEEQSTAKRPEELSPASRPEELSTAKRPEELSPASRPEELSTARRPGGFEIRRKKRFDL